MTPDNNIAGAQQNEIAVKSTSKTVVRKRWVFGVLGLVLILIAIYLFRIQSSSAQLSTSARRARSNTAGGSGGDRESQKR